MSVSHGVSNILRGGKKKNLRRRGNPVWGKPQMQMVFLQSDVAYKQTEWDQMLVKLGIHPTDALHRMLYRSSDKAGMLLYAWIKEHGTRRYVPEAVLKGLNLDVDDILVDKMRTNGILGNYSAKRIYSEGREETPTDLAVQVLNNDSTRIRQNTVRR
jgi:hypothetical protein